MKIVVDMQKGDLVKALKNKDVEESIKFYLKQEYSHEMTIDEFLNCPEYTDVVEVRDTIEYDVDKSFAKLLDKYNIPYGRFVLIEEDNEEDDRQSILDAKEIFDLDIYSEYQGGWIR